MKMPPEELKELGRRIRQRRLDLGLTYEQLAASISFQPTYLGKIERGRCNLTFLSLCQLVRALGIDLGLLLEKLLSPHPLAADPPETVRVPSDPEASGRRRKIEPEEIKRYRMRHGLTQKAMGRRCGVSASAITQWEAGRAISGSSALVLLTLLEGESSTPPLSPNEARLLDEGVQRGGYESREDYLANSLLGLIRDGRPDPTSDPETPEEQEAPLTPCG